MQRTSVCCDPHYLGIYVWICDSLLVVCSDVVYVVCSCIRVIGGMEADRGRKKKRGTVTEKVLCLN